MPDRHIDTSGPGGAMVSLTRFQRWLLDMLPEGRWIRQSALEGGNNKGAVAGGFAALERHGLVDGKPAGQVGSVPPDGPLGEMCWRRRSLWP